MYQNLVPLLLMLTAAVAVVALAGRLKLPSMLGYLVIGIALGPHGFSVLSQTETTAEFAEFGIVFLMFSIGLEFSLKRLKAMRQLVFGFGSSQMMLTALITGLVTWLAYGQGWKSGIVIGLAVAMSSTAIVARMLSDNFELHSRSGRQTMGVLLFQDLAVVPCLILLPALAAPGDGLLYALGVAAVQAVVVLALLVWVGQRYLGWILGKVAQHRSGELLVLSTLWIVVGLSYLTAQSGLSLALGAHDAGFAFCVGQPCCTRPCGSAADRWQSQHRAVDGLCVPSSRSHRAENGCPTGTGRRVRASSGGVGPSASSHHA